MKNNRIKEIAEKSQEHLSLFNFVGIRIQKSDYELKIGQSLNHCSSVWDDDNELDELLDGVSAIDITRTESLEKFGGYNGNVALILGSEIANGGNDVAEIIMNNPIILEIIF